MKPVILLLFVVIRVSAFAQEQIDTAILHKIRQEEKMHSQVGEIAHQLTEVAGSRLTNSPGYVRASHWAVAELKKWGLANSTLESFGEFGKGWAVEKFYAAIKTPYYQTIIAYPLAYSNSTNGALSAEVVLVNDSDSTWFAKNPNALNGKIALVYSGDWTVFPPAKAMPEHYTDSTLATLGETYMFSRALLTQIMTSFKVQRKFKERLTKGGALAILRKAEGNDGTAFVSGLYEFSKKIQPGLPEINLASEEFMKIMRLTKSGKVEMDLELRTKFYTDDLNGYNVVAEIPGADPKLKSEVVMLGGHLDSWHSGTGATDNAAGCTVMMEAVRILKALNLQPKRTIRIALWGGEEEGLLGSIGYVRAHFGDPVTLQMKPEQAKISGYFNLDNGTGKIRGIYLQNSEDVRPIFKKWFEPFANDGASSLNRNNTGGTDHLSFEAVGIPGFQFIQDPIEYESRTHHSNMDTYDHLLLDDLKQASVIVAAFVYQTATRTEMLPRKPLPKKGEWLFDVDFSGM